MKFVPQLGLERDDEMIKHVVGKQQKVRVEQTPDIVYKYFKNHKGTLTPLRMSLLVPQSTEKKASFDLLPGRRVHGS
ncbi:hypothetical protein [Secundilactobacillus collinoides]|uniref:hypothetical protein n=1 Tax=Secundilactobacillus collinoides TaxID=33960 RepID=UPI001584D0D6|nr:hypothetical protein [Secundilactobacillus collinoides]